MEDLMGSCPLPPTLLAIATLSKKIKESSHTLLPENLYYGYAYASLTNGKLGVWYSPSQVERHLAGVCAICILEEAFEEKYLSSSRLLLRVILQQSAHAEKLPQLQEKLLPGLVKFLIEAADAVIIPA